LLGRVNETEKSTRHPLRIRQQRNQPRGIRTKDVLPSLPFDTDTHTHTDTKSTDPDQSRSPRAKGWADHHLLLLIALLIVVVFHGGLLLQGSYQRTYDAWVHIFFADHYRRWWWSSWDPRWYTGFSTVSYPPGTHQSIALLSHVIGLRAGFVVVQFFALSNLTIGVYRWSRLWVSDRAAGWAAILLALSPAIAETVHVFGQLPTTFSLGFLLQSLPFAYRWVRDGGLRSLLAGIACTAACTAGHHVTTLFGSVFFVGPVLVSAVVERLRIALPNEPPSRRIRVTGATISSLAARRLRRILGPSMRAGLYGGLLGVALIIVVLPYWLWSASDPITQISIPHASRDSFLVNTNAGLVFFLIPWGLALLALPYAIVRGIKSKAWPLALSLTGLAFLGTGGTTPYPKLLLGAAYDILTLDRFTFWATIAILPLLGRMVVSLIDGHLAATIRLVFGRRLSVAFRALLAVMFVLFTLFAANLTHYRKFQPAALDPSPVRSFMEKDEHWRWRYLMLGFGDQMAWVSAQMTAQTVDGNYHSARRLPELTSRPVERLEGAKYSGVPGIGSLQQFLSVPSRYSLKFVFSNDQFYDPLLHFTGWHQIGTLQNGVAVWEKSDVTPLSGDDPNRQIPLWQRQMWGILPLSAIVFAVFALLWTWAGQPVPRLLRRIAGLGRRVLWWTPLGTFATWVDRILSNKAALIEQLAPLEEKRLPKPSRLDQVLMRSVPRFVHVTATLTLVVVTTLVVAPTFKKQVVPLGPAALVADYYDQLDFRRFPQAYAMLDPQTRPTYEEFSIDLSIDGGLVASFSKMRSITTKEVDRAGEQATVRADINYETSLKKFPKTNFVTTVRRSGVWKIRIGRPDLRQPIDQFAARPALDYSLNLQAALRTFEAGPTARPDVLDRPRLWIGDTRTLRRGEQWMVIGRVINIDVDPADVTITAQLRDSNSKLLATYDAAQTTLHKILPGESTPFRIDFESTAGTTAANAEFLGKKATKENTKPVTAIPIRQTGPIEFDPSVITPLQLPDGVNPTTTDVYARAVVLGRESRRGLQLTNLGIETDRQGANFIVGTLRNDSTVEASVPMLLFSYYDHNGDLSWVTSEYLEHSIRPQWSIPFRIPLASMKGIDRVDIPTIGHADNAGATPGIIKGPPPMLTLPAASGFSALSVQATAYAREGGGL
jgi:hypothetical protein